MRYPLVKSTVGYQDLRDAMVRLGDCGLLSWRNPVVAEFEEAFAEYIGSKYAVALSSGTAALHVAYDITTEDCCTIPACAYVAVQSAAFYNGMSLDVEDVDAKTWNLDRLARPSRVVVAVHTLGNPCDLDGLKGGFLIEDACEALGGTWKGKKLGSIGDIGVFSFYGNKIITAGEGGILVTNNGAYAHEARLLRNHMAMARYSHDGVGYNYRMTAFQAALLLVQLPRLDRLVAERQRGLARYRENLGDRMQQTLPDGTHAAWMAGVGGFTNAVTAAVQLADAGIESRPMFAPLGLGPIAKWLRRSALMFPLWPDLDGIDYICEKIVEVA